ncbi:MAG: hypothetical protein HC843_13695 [Sphingomonadales bacterium]|nr:hypothetical protein [Sphingomonadales bacterium]
MERQLRITVRVPVDIHIALQAEAKKRNLGITNIAREALLAGLPLTQLEHSFDQTRYYFLQEFLGQGMKYLLDKHSKDDRLRLVEDVEQIMQVHHAKK